MAARYLCIAVLIQNNHPLGGSYCDGSSGRGGQHQLAGAGDKRRGVRVMHHWRESVNLCCRACPHLH